MKTNKMDKNNDIYYVQFVNTNTYKSHFGITMPQYLEHIYDAWENWYESINDRWNIETRFALIATNVTPTQTKKFMRMCRYLEDILNKFEEYGIIDNPRQVEEDFKKYLDEEGDRYIAMKYYELRGLPYQNWEEARIKYEREKNENPEEVIQYEVESGNLIDEDTYGVSYTTCYKESEKELALQEFEDCINCGQFDFVDLVQRTIINENPYDTEYLKEWKRNE